MILGLGQEGVRKIEVGPQGGRLIFAEQPNVDPVQIIQLIQTQPDRYKLDGNEKLRFFGDYESPELRADSVGSLLETLAGSQAA